MFNATNGEKVAFTVAKTTRLPGLWSDIGREEEVQDPPTPHTVPLPPPPTPLAQNAAVHKGVRSNRARGVVGQRGGPVAAVNSAHRTDRTHSAGMNHSRNGTGAIHAWNRTNAGATPTPNLNPNRGITWYWTPIPPLASGVVAPNETNLDIFIARAKELGCACLFFTDMVAGLGDYRPNPTRWPSGFKAAADRIRASAPLPFCQANIS